MTRRNQAGQAIAELALVLPLLLLILLGCLDLGRGFSAWLTLANGSREGARYASLYPADQDGIVRRTREEVEAEGLSGKQLRVAVQVAPSLKSGEPVTVTCAYTMPVFTFMLFGGKPLRIMATTHMAIIPERRQTEP